MEQWKPDEKELLAYFKAHHYKWITQYLRHDWVNWYFAPEDHPRLPEIAAVEKARPPKVKPSAAPDVASASANVDAPGAIEAGGSSTAAMGTAPMP